MLPPKKKKRRKHQDTPTQATTPAAAAAGPTAPASTAPKSPKHVHHAASNGPAALPGAAANSPARFSPANGVAVASAGGSHAAATGGTPHADQATANGSSEQQATAAVENGAADPGQGREHSSTLCLSGKTLAFYRKIAVVLLGSSNHATGVSRTLQASVALCAGHCRCTQSVHSITLQILLHRSASECKLLAACSHADTPCTHSSS